MVSAHNFLEQRITAWSVVTLILLLFAITNLPWRLDDYDQAKQAFTSFEMVKEGHWFYQRTPNEKAATKPPLVGWASAAIFGVTGSWGLAWRLPSFVAALTLLAIIGRAATKASGPVPGLIAMSAFGLNLLSLRLATLVRTDMPLALVVFLLGWQIWEKLRNKEPWQPRDRILTFALLTAAVLIKGPIIYAFLLPGIALFQWRQRSEKQSLNAWPGWWPWLASFGIFLLWVIGGILFAPNFFNEVIVREFAGRFGETIHRAQPIYFYFPHLLHKFAPWSIFGIALAVIAVRAEKVRWQSQTSGDVRKHVPPRELVASISPDTWWLLCWSFGGLIVMSLIPSKRVDRIFPVIPPLCLLLAALLARMLSQENLRKRAMRWSAVSLLIAVVFSAGYTTAKVVRNYRAGRGALVSFGQAVRAQASANHWRYEVVGGREEGMLLYLERLRFAKPEEVIARWNAGELDAVVAPEDERARWLRDLEGSIPSRIRSWKNDNDRVPRYILLTRS